MLKDGASVLSKQGASRQSKSQTRYLTGHELGLEQSNESSAESRSKKMSDAGLRKSSSK